MAHEHETYITLIMPAAPLCMIWGSPLPLSHCDSESISYVTYGNTKVLIQAIDNRVLVEDDHSRITIQMHNKKFIERGEQQVPMDNA